LHDFSPSGTVSLINGSFRIGSGQRKICFNKWYYIHGYFGDTVILENGVMIG